MDYKDWVKTLRECSFRGVNFLITSAEDKGGRNIKNIEGSYDKSPSTEDTGRKLRDYSMSAFIVGDDCWEKSEKLRKACEDIGYGELVHPILGILIVRCVSFARSLEKKGIVKISLTFIERGDENIGPIITQNPTAILNEKVTISDAVNLETFSSSFELPKIPKAAEAVADVAKGYAEALKSAIEQVNNTVLTVSDAVNDISSIGDEIVSTIALLDDVVNNTLSLLSTPAVFASKIQVATSLFRKVVSKTVDGLHIVKKTADTGVDLSKINTATPAGQSQLESMQRVIAFSKADALNSQASILPEVTFNNKDEVREYIDDFNDQADEILDTATLLSSDFMNSISDVVASAGKYTNDVVANAAELTSVNLKETEPAVVLAYDLYQDVSRTDEILSTNKIQHPLFLPPGKYLEVLKK